MNKQRSCSTCQGSGMVRSGAGILQRCPMCEGTGVQFDPGRFFTYELGPIALNANQALAFQSAEVLNHDFRWMFAAAQFTGVFTSQVLDSRDQRPFSNQQVHNANLWGTAQNPLPLLTPFQFNKNSQILVNLTDLSGAPNTVRLAFIGVEVD